MVIEYQSGGALDWGEKPAFEKFLSKLPSEELKVSGKKGQQFMVFEDVISAGVKVRVECDGKSYTGTTADYFVASEGVLALTVDLGAGKGTKGFLASNTPKFYLL